ncbi:MAG: hypothetical protein K0Q72_5188 [Armatimonadetes bacterium]|nr:hypothetical protein [Armatimonadota bacterium]
MQDRLERLRAATGIEDFENVSAEQFQVLLQQVARRKLNTDQLELLVEVMPQFVELQRETIGGLQEIVGTAGHSQSEALQTAAASLSLAGRTLEILAQRMESDTARVELARLTLELARTSAQVTALMNRDNNRVWHVLAGAAGAAVVIIAALAVNRSAQQ